MNKATLIKQVNDLVQADQTGDAINVLLDFLDGHQREQPELYEEVLQLKAIFKRAKRQVSMNIISEEHAEQELEELNATVKNILLKLDDTFKSKSKPKPIAPATKNYNFLYGIAAALLGLLAIVAFTVLRKPEAPKAAFCPSFDSASKWHTLIVPYQYSTDNKNEIKTKLDSVSNAVSFKAACEMADINFNDGGYPNTLQKAKNIGRGCQADLIFWKNISESINKTRYHFVNLGDNFQFNLLSPNPGRGVSIDSIIVETSIPTSNELSASEDETIYPLLLGIGANRASEHLMTIRILDALPDSMELSTDFTLLKQLHLADSYRLLNRKEKAIAAYSNILDNYDGYTLASLNRGVLHWSLGNYKKSVKDFDTVLKADSTHLVALYARGRTCLDMGIVDAAITNLTKAESLIGQNSSEGLINYMKKVVDISLRDANKQKSELLKLIANETSEISKNKNNPKFNNKFARYYLEVGDTHKAIGLLYRLGPGELESATKKVVRNRLIVLADKNFRADLEAFLIDG